jgi:hypothetical protein
VLDIAKNDGNNVNTDVSSYLHQADGLADAVVVYAAIGDALNDSGLGSEFAAIGQAMGEIGKIGDDIYDGFAAAANDLFNNGDIGAAMGDLATGIGNAFSDIANDVEQGLSDFADWMGFGDDGDNDDDSN